jgi:hypothetical protein
MAKKPKKLNLSPEDRIIGMQPREKRDLYAGCNEPGKKWFHPDAHVFMKHFCRFCKNADCIRAKGAVSPWHTRMAEQVDYLLNDPQFSDMKDPAHLRVAQQAFDDIGRKMLKLDVARTRQDWEIPGGPTDGHDKLSEPETTDQFDDAVKELAKARGKEEPDLQRPEGTDAPAHFQEEGDEDDGDLYEYDTQYPSEDGKRSYHVILHKDGRWTCECKGFGRWNHCKHLTQVRSWYDENSDDGDDDDGDDGGGDTGPTGPAGPAPAPAPPPKPSPAPDGAAAQPPRDPRVPAPDAAYNTPMPQGGVMVGGGQAPDQEMQRRPRVREAKDPWAIQQDKIVEPGATVTVKSGKKKT